MEHHFISTKNLGTQLRDDLTVDLHHTSLDKLIGLTTAAYSSIGQILVKADWLIGIEMLLFIFYTLLQRIFGIRIVVATFLGAKATLRTLAIATTLLTIATLRTLTIATTLLIATLRTLTIATTLLIATAWLTIAFSLLLTRLETAFLRLTILGTRLISSTR